jgi:putative restriction endonuclease
MNWQDVLALAGNLRVAPPKEGRGPRPHKPLLVLYALGQWRRGIDRLNFDECSDELAFLLHEFGAASATGLPEYPFWRLRRDNLRGHALWEVRWPGPAQADDSVEQASAMQLSGAWGAFTQPVQAILREADERVGQLAHAVLIPRYFPTDEFPHERLQALQTRLGL